MKIVPGVDILNLKDRVTAPAKDAPKENGVLKSVLKKNQFVPIASLDAMVSHTLVLKRKRPALNAAKEDFH